SVLVLDCGATNVRAIAVDIKGNIIAQSSLPNNTQADPENKSQLIWDVWEIWGKMKTTAAQVIKKTGRENIAAVTITTFGVDGATFTKDGSMTYPVISWQCSRTEPVMSAIDKYIPLEKLYGINGVQPFSFNTINKLIWLKENKPEILEKSDAFLFMPSVFNFLLTGEMVNDTTMLGTSMLTDLKTRKFSAEILESIGVDPSIFPDFVEPGKVIGEITKKAENEIGIPAGVPVIATGHDTQFAIFGSGAGENEPVISSGTWEILMVRARQVATDAEMLKRGVTNEFDAVPGLYNTGIQWIASGMLEWIKKMFFRNVDSNENIYDLMINEALSVDVGSGGIRIRPDFFEIASGNNGVISGLTMDTSRGQIYRAALESLAYRTKESLEFIEKTGGFTSKKLICVGGGSKNKLWNQIKADVLQLPVKVIQQKETTVLGAALFAMSGAGLYNSPDEARSVIDYKGEVYEPGENSKIYNV
ncbi:MAG: L-fuculokinase, partial [Bacteroidales bacterium]|nr:L-fuculokinase [Bacteroidales bacterium]